MIKTKGSFLDSLKNLCLEVFLFLAIVVIINLLFQIQKNKLAIQEVCNVISENYLEGLTPESRKECLQVVSLLDFNHKVKIQKFNSWFKQFHISHLYIYNAVENKKMWLGQSRETGIVVKKLFGKWKVIEVLTTREPQVKIGDEILAINGKKVKSSSQVANTEGVFTILRKNETYKFNIVYSEIVYDERMIGREINSEWGYLKIPSFKSEFFGYDELSRLYPDMKHQNLVVDVRDNFGGNFISILRLLSMLKCTDSQVGQIFHNRTEPKGENYLKDDLSDVEQIQQVTHANPIILKLFKTELCVNTKKVVVLMNEKTASVSELFVQILKNQYQDIKVFGTNSAGQMVLSIWYPLKFLGPEVMISIPYAWATGTDQEVLEGLGVAPTEHINSKKLNLFTESLDPLLDYVLEQERIVPMQKSSLGGING